MILIIVKLLSHILPFPLLLATVIETIVSTISDLHGYYHATHDDDDDDVFTTEEMRPSSTDLRTSKLTYFILP